MVIISYTPEEPIPSNHPPPHSPPAILEETRTFIQESYKVLVAQRTKGRVYFLFLAFQRPPNGAVLGLEETRWSWSTDPICLWSYWAASQGLQSVKRAGSGFHDLNGFLVERLTCLSRDEFKIPALTCMYRLVCVSLGGRCIFCVPPKHALCFCVSKVPFHAHGFPSISISFPLVTMPTKILWIFEPQFKGHFPTRVPGLF